MTSRVKDAFNRVFDKISTWIGEQSWSVRKVITVEEKAFLNEKLTTDYYVILTRHSGHLSTWAISVAHFFLTGRFGYYGHALMNLEDTVNTVDDFRFVEATAEGVHYSGFNEVFDAQCSSVALLKVKNLSLEEWTAVLDRAKSDVGKEYDTLFDLAEDQRLSCVELVRHALQSEPNYETDFASFEDFIKKTKGRLDPQMFYESDCFETVYEIRH